jgi:ATP-binding cassette subfamily B protein
MKSQQTLQNLMSYMAPHKLQLFLATISSILNKLCDIVPEILIGIAIDIVVNQNHSIVSHITGISNPFTQLYIVAGLTALLWILESVFEYCHLILWRGIGQAMQHSLRIATYDHMQNADIAYFEDKKTGGLLAIVNDDINQLELFLSEGPNAVIQLVINIIVMGLLFTYLSPTLALLNLLPIPFVLLIAFYFQNRLAHLYETVREKVEKLSSHIASRLAGITTIKSYTSENYERTCLSTESMSYTQANYAAGKVNAAYIPLVRMCILSGFILSMIVGGCYALQGTLSISFYSVLVFLTQRFLWPFTTVTTITDMYERAMACTRRIFAVLHHKKEITDGEHNLNKNTVQGSITFKNVNFSYSNGVQIFDKFSLTIPAQKTVAFVGTTGSGKSTIIKLILRLYDTTSGAILLDNNDIKNLTTDSLRQAIALVSQEVYLTDSSITHNIAYGSPHATQEEIINAAKMAEAHEFIMALPHGYDSLVGENGKNLSGGQRQRISIARAILKNPPIFIFDEATSALDNETEAAIQHSMKTLAHNHTMIIVAHRLSTIRHADIIFVLEKGNIVESGTHQELLERKETYYNLWKIQSND